MGTVGNTSASKWQTSRQVGRNIGCEVGTVTGHR